MDSLRHGPKPLQYRYVLHNAGSGRWWHWARCNCTARTIQLDLPSCLGILRRVDKGLCDLVPAARVSCCEEGLIAMTKGDV